MIELDSELQNNLSQIKNNISSAAAVSKRSLSDINLLAVSKNHSIEKIDIINKLGLKEFGENRVQELMDKYRQRPDVSWHFIGHLQRNKVKYLMRMENCRLIHSLDSWRLAKEINKRAAENNRVMPVLVEVNVSGDKNKYGISSEEVHEFLRDTLDFKNIRINGLMTILPYVDNPEEVRPFFKKMADIKKDMINRGFKNIKELSMGMSNDYLLAIEEGATIVRIGSFLFGRRGE